MRHAVLEVTDTGIGDDGGRARSAASSRSLPRKVNAALALVSPLVYGVVQRHGGSLDVVSTPDAGTTFIIRLPLASPAGTSDVPGEPAPAGMPLRVLLVDDQVAVREVRRRPC